MKVNQSRPRRQMFSSQQEAGSRAQGLTRGPDPVFPLLFHENPAVFRIPRPATFYLFFFFHRFPEFLFCLWVFSEKAARLRSRLGRLGRFRQGVIRNILPFVGGGGAFQLLNYP